MDERLRDQLERLSPAQRELFRALSPAEPAALSPPEPAARAEPARYALAPAQERFWLLEQLTPGEPAHHVAGALVLQGALDVDALRRALAGLVARHAVLRTTFVVESHTPVAVIEPAAAVPLAREDLTPYDELHRRARLRELRAANGQAAFDLRQAPLLRCTLVQLAPAEWQLLWCVHHIAADGLSMVVLGRELAHLYTHHRGEGPALPAPTCQYHDFAQAQAAREQRGDFAPGLAWLRERLHDAPATTLPGDRAPGGTAATGNREQRELAPELARALLALGHAHGCTPFVTLLAGFVAALRRHAAADDLVLGIPVGNRASADWQHAVGPFVNSAVLRVRARGDLTFAALLANVRGHVAATLAHGDVPFERLVQHLRPERHLDRNPLFQVMFNFVDFAALDAPPPGLQWRYEETPAGTLFHFTLWVRRRGDTIVLEAEYDPALFTAATIERRLGELHTLLQGAVTAPETTLAALPLLPPDELAALRGFENGPPLPGGAGDVLALVHAAPTGARVVDAQGAYTLAEVLAAAAAVAARLAAAGVQPGDRVALSMARSGALPAAMLGVWQAGAVLVPLDPALPALRRDAVLAAARPACVLADTAGAASGVREVAFPHGEGAAAGFAPRAIAGGAPAYVLFTSGSTGSPKGVIVPHAALAAFLRAARATFGIGAHDVLLAITPPTFDIALLELLLPLCCGATVHVASTEAVRDGAVLARELAASRASWLQATPSTFRLLLEAGWRGDDRLRLLCGGEALTGELARALRRHCRELWNVYGPTETTIWSTAGLVGDGDVHIGRPLPGTTCRVLDEHGERVPIACRGELWIGGAGVATGYLDDEHGTAARFTAGSYRTGDQVRWTHEGALVFCGRADGQVKVRGHRVELAEIEAHARAHADVADAVATTIAGADGLDVAVHVVPRATAARGTSGALAWRDVWQQVYAGAAADPDFDCRGWIDSRDGRAIPEAGMRAWRDHTVARLRELAPRAVLEVGCGTGLITVAAAARCERWLALDQAPAAVAAVQAMATRHRWTHVGARVLAAHALDELPAHAFDCVVLNSVVQYFPDLQYLLAVLDAARRRLRVGGVIFVGDVRLLPLHGALAAWIEDAAAAPSLVRTEFAARCERRCAHDPELLLDGALFAALVRAGAFADHWLALRAGGGDTEMDRFRADVVLTVDSRFAPPAPLRGAPLANARVAAAAAMYAHRHDAAFADVASLRAQAAAARGPATEPDTLGGAVIPAADGVGLTALGAPLHERVRAATAVAPLPDASTLQHLASTPHAATRDAGLREALRAHLLARLPGPVVPRHIVVMAALPRLPSGKIDRRSLPPPLRAAGGVEPLATPTERRVAGLFGELLGLQRAGASDDFFALGGHSLAAARLLARVRTAFHVDLPLRAVFQAPTVRALAAAIDAAPRTELPPLRPRERREPLRPTGTMLRLWFLQRLAPGSRAYLMWGLVEARGALDLDALRRAVQDVAGRHEVLGLRLAEQDGAATLAARGAPVPFHLCADAATFERTLRELTGDALEPLQVFAMALAPAVHRLAFVLHHAYADGWSIDVLQRDLLRAYAARCRGSAPVLAPPAVSWLDYAAWQHEMLTGSRRERLVAFWRDELREAPPALALPAATPRPTGPAEHGGTLAVALPDEHIAAAKALAAAHGATLFHVLLAAFTAWLSRLAGQHDVIVGTTIANRDDPAVDDVIGCFVNTLPLRARLHERPSFAAHLAHTRDTVMRAMEHRHLPFQDLVDAVDAPRSLAHSPLFQATLDWFEQPAQPLRLGDVELTRLPHDPGAAKFELSLLVHGEQPFRGSLEYRADLFPAPIVAAWWRAFEVLFASALATPAMPVDELPWLDEPARARLLAAGRGPVREWPDGDVVAAFAAAAARTPHAVALRTDSARCTYGELLGRVAALAAELRALGIARGARVALHVERSPELIVAVLAVLAVGAAYVPLDVDLPLARRQAMLAAADVRLGLCADPAPRELAGVPWHRASAQPPGTAPPPLVLPELRRDDPAYVLFTSGSTGAPKGVIVSHRALRNYALWARDTYDAAGGAALPTPLGFDLSITALFPVLLAGGAVYLPPPGDGALPLLAALAHGPFGLLKVTPSHLRALLAARPAADVASAARGLVLGGEALDHELVAPLRGTGQRHWNEYGPTEATVGCACHEVPANASPRGPVPIGRAIANMRLYLLDAHRAPVPQGVIGELWIAGAGLADGYLGRAELTDAVFAADPFAPGERMYRSGDRAAFTAGLELVYHGRIDAQVKIRGHRVEPGEACALLLAQPGVRAAAVMLASAPAGGEHLVAYVTGSADEAVLQRALAAALPAPAVPARIVTVPALPLNRHGKLDRDALPDPWLPDPQRTPRVGDGDAGDDATVRLVQLARELLRVPDLTAHDDFFRAGGDSILALQLVARAAGLGLQLSVTDVFKTPRLADLRRAARATEHERAAVAEPTSGPLLPMQKWFFAQHFAAPRHYDQAIWLTLRAAVPVAAIQQALDQLIARHPALRSRCDAHGQQVLAARKAALTEGEAEGLAPFDPERGDLFAATLVAGGAAGPDLLHLRAHHLAVDAVSWRLLAEELEALLLGRTLPPPTASPIAFATWLDAACRGGALAGDAVYLRALPAPAVHWPARCEGDAAIGTARLPAPPRHVRVDEVLLAATARAIAAAANLTSLRVDVEGHGRAVPGAPDVHRTVGWFTTVHAVVLDQLDAPPVPRLAHAKQRLRAAPHGGAAALALALPPAPVLCNHLGVIDAGPGELLALAARDVGPLRDPRNRRSHAIEVRTAVRGGELAIEVHTPERDGMLGAQRLAGAIAAEAELLLGGAAGIDDVYALTPTQQGMFFHAQKDPHALAYREQLVAVVAGALDTAALAAAFQDVAARHELLRGEVHWRGLPEPHWVIRRSTGARVHTIALPAGDGEPEALRRFAAGEVARAFAFGGEPLVRVQLVALARERHALVVTYHHVVLDGWSMPLLLGELVHCYRARCGEALPALAPPAPFHDHVAFLQRQDSGAQRTFWRERLAGFDTPVDVPGDRAPAANERRAHDEVERWLDARGTADLQHFARTHGLTASTLVAAAWALVLWRCSGQRDVLFGVTVAGRDAAFADAERRIGLFINTLPLRLLVEPDRSVAAWLHAVQQLTADALLHQHTPLPLAQAQTDVPAGVEPFQSLLVFENYPLAAALRDLPHGLSLEATTAFERTSYPLTVVAIPGERLCLRLLHDAARWSGGVAAQLLDGLLALLRELVRAPDARLGELPWLDGVRARAVELARGPAARAPHEPVLARLLRAAAATPDAVAIASGDGSTTYGELAAMARAAAGRIAAHTHGDEALVALCCAPGAFGIAVMLGAWWAGAAYLPLDPGWPDARLHECIAGARAALVVGDATTLARLPRDVRALQIEDLVAPHGPPPAPPPDEPRRLAYAICTSGTTGRPKIVLIEHGSLANYVGAAIDEFALSPRDRVLQFASWAFDTAAEELWPALGTGAALVLCPAPARASSAAFVAFSTAARATVWDLPTAYFHALAAALPHAPAPLPPSLRLCILGGQACRAAAARTFLQHAHGRVRLLETYGPSEATIVATWNELTPALVTGDAPPPIGRPVPGASAWVLGRDLGLLPLGMPGELCLGGIGLARGYLDDDAASRERFVVHPLLGERLYRTGDRARWRDDGTLELLGRLDRQVKVAGVRVELDDVAAALQRHPDVIDAMVVAIPGDDGEPRLTAHVEIGHVEAHGIDAAALRAFVSRTLPAAFVPAAFVVHERLPRTVAGKVDARALQASAPPPEAARAATPREATVLAIFAALFPARTIGRDDDFFALGGSSLLAVRLLDALHRECGVELPLQTLFARPTPAGIASALDGSGAGGAAAAGPDLLAEAQLPDAFPVPVRRPWRAPDRVLLTGATGFFGRLVLAELLARGAAVWCLVRARDEDTARQRLRTAAGADAAAAVQIVCGDLTAADLGLPPRVRDELGRTVTTVVHAAAAVDFLRPYARLRDVNVGGTLAVLRFCAEHGALLHHVSSIGIFDDARVDHALTIGEDDDARRFDRPVSGYAQSKWVAEQLVRAAGERGLAAVVHRPGRLIAASAAASGDGTSFVAAAMRLCNALGLAPVSTARFDLTPADWAAKALVHLAHAPHAGATFHLVHPAPPTGSSLMRLWHGAGWKGTAATWPEFRAAAIDWLRGDAGSAHRQLLPFLVATPDAPPGEPVFACARTLQAIGATGPRCPPIDGALVGGWLRGLTV